MSADGTSFCAASRTYQLQWLSFFMLGTLNNLSYVVVNSAAKSLADSFNQGDLIGAVVWSNVGFGIAIRALNTFYLLRTSYTRRMVACVVLMVIGCLGVAVGTWINFYFCLAGVVLVGCFSSLGESVLLGFLKDFNPALMGAWSSGTGMAGVGGTLMYLLLYSVVGMSNRSEVGRDMDARFGRYICVSPFSVSSLSLSLFRLIFFIQIPLVLVYWLAFRYVNRGVADPSTIGGIVVSLRKTSPSRTFASLEDSGEERVRVRERVEKEKEERPESSAANGVGECSPHTAATLTLLGHEGSPSVNEHGSSGSTPESSIDFRSSSLAHSDSDVVEETESLEAQEFYARETGLQRTIRVTKVIASPAFQLAAVYFFEYVVSVGFASKANLNPDKDDWWQVNAYELLAFCYQVGVLIARSSVSIIQIRSDRSHANR
jgi:hypothetical protein